MNFKNLLIIDAKYALYRPLAESFVESFRKGLTLIAANLKLELKPDIQFEQEYATLKSLLNASDSFEKRMQQLLDRFFAHVSNR